MKDLTIIIINWNSKRLLLECLQSIVMYEKLLNYEVIVIDNDSKDVIEDLTTIYPTNHNFIKLKENIGFGRACNLAAQQAKSNMLLFLGPDTQIISDDALYGLLLEYRKNGRWGALGCQFVGVNGDEQLSTMRFPSPANIISEWWWENTHNVSSVLRKLANKPLVTRKEPIEICDSVLGHCLMVEKKKFDAIGGFPQDVFLFSEDIEVCKKLIDAGYVNGKSSLCRVIHHKHQSVKDRYAWDFIYLVQESLVRFNIKYYGPASGALFSIAVVFRTLWNIIFLSIFMVNHNYKNYLMGNLKVIQYHLYVRFRRLDYARRSDSV